MIFQPNQRIVFIGDSITDCGRRDYFQPYGSGYVSHLHDLIVARYPELKLRIVNRGIGGDTVRHLAERWHRDVIGERPDWLSVKIGINDVWRAFGTNSHESVPLPEYEETLRRLLDQAQQQTGTRLILATPYMIEPNRSVPMRRQMDWYGDVVRKLAPEYDALLVDTQAAFDTVLQHTTPGNWADDQIHPNSAGHMVIALAWLRAVGFEL